DELPADPPGARRAIAVDAMSRAADLAELLDVDVDHLAGPRALVAVGRLGRLDRRQLLQTQPGDDRADSPLAHAQHLGDLHGVHADLAPELCDHLLALSADPARAAPSRAGLVVGQLAVATTSPADPLAGALDADSGGLGRLRQRPALIEHPIGQKA